MNYFGQQLNLNHQGLSFYCSIQIGSLYDIKFRRSKLSFGVKVVNFAKALTRQCQSLVRPYDTVGVKIIFWINSK